MYLYLLLINRTTTLPCATEIPLGQSVRALELFFKIAAPPLWGAFDVVVRKVKAQRMIDNFTARRGELSYIPLCSLGLFFSSKYSKAHHKHPQTSSGT